MNNIYENIKDKNLEDIKMPSDLNGVDIKNMFFKVIKEIHQIKKQINNESKT